MSDSVGKSVRHSLVAQEIHTFRSITVRNFAMKLYHSRFLLRPHPLSALKQTTFSWVPGITTFAIPTKDKAKNWGKSPKQLNGGACKSIFLRKYSGIALVFRELESNSQKASVPIFPVAFAAGPRKARVFAVAVVAYSFMATLWVRRSLTTGWDPFQCTVVQATNTRTLHHSPWGIGI